MRSVQFGSDLPEGITDDQECDIHFVRISQNIIAFQLDGFSGGRDDFLSIELLLPQEDISIPVLLCHTSAD